jgi:hypothetical protein
VVLTCYPVNYDAGFEEAHNTSTAGEKKRERCLRRLSRARPFLRQATKEESDV